MPRHVRFEIGDQEIDGDDYFVVIEPVFWAVSIYERLVSSGVDSSYTGPLTNSECILQIIRRQHLLS